MADYISVGEALKLVSPFKGDKREVLAFIANVDTAFEVINPENSDVLYKFVLTRISGEPRLAIAHRHLENWDELKTFLRNTYTEKRTLDFHATQLFGARQGKSESISEWIQTIQKLSSKFREAALQDCEDDERVGIIALADKLRNICFVQGISSDRIQTIVRSRNGNAFDDIAETALEEESAIFSKNERYKQGTAFGRLVCSNCGKTGHAASKCYFRDKRDVRVSKLGAETRGGLIKYGKEDFKCYNCGEVGHMARNCKKPRHPRKGGPVVEPGVEGRPPDRVNPSIGSVNTLGSRNGTATECIRMRSDICNGNELLLLVDTGADISSLKPNNLDKTKQFDPEGRVQVKSVSGSTIQTLGSVQAVLYEGSVRIPFTFQLVNKRVDLPCDGIIGRDFLAHAGARICYETGTLTLGSGEARIHKVLTPIETENRPKGVRRLVLPSRAEIVVGLLVDGTTKAGEGLTEKEEVQGGVYLAGAITKVQAGRAITSIVNTTDNEVEIDEPVLKITELEEETWSGAPVGGNTEYDVNRPGEVLKRLRLGHLNGEERKAIEKACSDYHDIFHLPGEVLSATTVVKHEIRLEPGAEPVNARPYRLPESQKREVRRQVEDLKRGDNHRKQFSLEQPASCSS